MKKICTIILCVVMLLVSNVTVFATEMNEMQEEMTYESDLLKRFGFASGDAEKEASEEVVSTSSAPIVYAVDEELINEGKKLFDNFMQVSEFIEKDGTWKDCLEYYGGIARLSGFTETYLETVSGATQEKADEMTSYQFMIYVETYLRFSGMTNAANKTSQNRYIFDGENGITALIKRATSTWNGNNAEEVIAAYKEFLNWQVEYYRTYNFPYNFMTGRSYAEEMGATYVAEPAKETTGDITEDELQEIMAELTTEDIKEIKEELVAEGILDENEVEEKIVITADKKNSDVENSVFPKVMVVIGLFAVLVAVCFVMRFVRTKQK